MVDVDDFFDDVVDTPKEATEQHKKGEELKGVIDKGKLGHKWTHKKVDKASDEIINKAYAECKQCNGMKKEKKQGRPWGSILIYTLLAFLRWLKSGTFTNYARTLRMI